MAITKEDIENKDIEIRELTITEQTLEDGGVDMEELDEVVSEAISNMTGFCHHGFELEIKVTAKLDISE